MQLTDSVAQRVLGDRTAVADALAHNESTARSTVDPSLLELCELRVASLLGRAEWTGEPASALERACVDLTEQWVVDVASVSDAQVGAVSEHLGDDGLMDFLHALLVVEQRLRLVSMWERLGLAGPGS